MNKNLVTKLFDTVLEKRKVHLNPMQQANFLTACEKTIAENPTLDFDERVMAAGIYLNHILRNPDIRL